MKTMLKAASAALAFGVWAGAATADTISLTAVSGYAPSAGWVRDFEGFFIPAVDAALAVKGEHKINWNKAFSGQIAKVGEELEAVQTGLGDIGIVVLPVETDKVPLYGIAYYTPFTSDDIALMAAIIDNLAEKHPSMLAQWEPLNQVPLASTGSVDNYQLLSTKPIETLDQLAGLKIGASGPNQAWVSGLGAVPVTMNMASAYNDLKTGVEDAIMLHSGGGLNAKIYEVAPYHITARFGAAVAFVVTVNKQTWDGLPADVQETLRTVAKQYAIVTAKGGELDGILGRQAYEANGGTMLEISDDERRAWAAKLPPIAREWAAEMDAKGLAGTAVLTDYMNAMRAAGQDVMRNWDE